jgi:hypothetical protein
MSSTTTSAKKGFGIQQWVPHQKQKFRATAVAIAASISAWMRRHWFHAPHVTSSCAHIASASCVAAIVGVK